MICIKCMTVHDIYVYTIDEHDPAASISKYSNLILISDIYISIYVTSVI